MEFDKIIAREREELGHLDEEEREAGLDDRPVDLWQNVRLLYLIKAATAEIFTFVTSSWGGRRAVT